MKPLIKLILPEKSEILLYVSLAFTLLVFVNLQKIWQFYAGAVTFNEVSRIDDFSLAIQDYFLQLEATIDPRIADFTMWIVVGILVVTVMMTAQHAIEDAETESSIEKRTRSTSLRWQERRDFIARWLLGISSAVLLLLWVRLLFGALLPDMSLLFFIGATHMGSLLSYFYLLYSSVLLGTALYALAILVRLLSLKIRVFQ